MRGIQERAYGSSYKHERWENEPIKRVREYATMLEMAWTKKSSQGKKEISKASLRKKVTQLRRNAQGLE